MPGWNSNPLGAGRVRFGLLVLSLGLGWVALTVCQRDGVLGVWGKAAGTAHPVRAAEGPVAGIAPGPTDSDRVAQPTPPAHAAAQTASDSESVEPGADVRLGRLSILRSDGTWDTAPDGELEVQTWAASTGAHSAGSIRGTGVLAVSDGRFELSPELTDESVARFVQPLAFVDANDQVAAIPFDGSNLWSTDAELANFDLELSAAEAQPLHVTAIDGLSGLPLSRLSVEVFPTVEVLATPPGELDAPAIQKTSGATPLILDPLPLLGGRSPDCSLRVGAQGYASTAVVVDRREPVELELVLWPASTLCVRTKGDTDGTTWLEVERLDGGTQVTRHLLSGASRELSGLEPGVYAVTWVEVSATGVQRRLDRASARLSSGEARELWLEAPSRKPLESISQVAELWLPESWFELEGSEVLDGAIDTSEHLLVLRAAQSDGFASTAPTPKAWLGEPAPMHGATGRGLASLGSAKHEGAPGRLFEFSAAGLPAGRYAATLIPEGVALWIELQPFGGETPRFVAPEPVEWELDTHAVAEFAGHEPPGPLRWAVELPGYQGPRIPREVLPNEEGRYEFLAPRGELSLELAGTAWAIEVHQQRTDVPCQTLELTPLTQFGLFLQLEDQPFPWSGNYDLELRSDAGESAVYAFEGHSLLSRLGVGTSGAYRVVVRTPRGSSWTSTPLYFGSVGHEKIVKLTPQ